jgi:quinol monooxygenase YgiN
MMVIVSGRIYVASGQREVFLSISGKSMIEARRAPGCRDFVVAADPIEPNRVNVYEEWDSADQLEAFRGDGPGAQLAKLIESADVRRHVIASSGAA